MIVGGGFASEKLSYLSFPLLWSEGCCLDTREENRDFTNSDKRPACQTEAFVSTKVDHGAWRHGKPITGSS